MEQSAVQCIVPSNERLDVIAMTRPRVRQTTQQLRRFAVAMEFVAVAVMERELHKLIGLASWHLANAADGDLISFGVDASLRAEGLRRLAGLFGENAECVQRSRALVRASRTLLMTSV